MTYAFSIRGKDLRGNGRWFFVDTEIPELFQSEETAIVFVECARRVEVFRDHIAVTAFGFTKKFPVKLSWAAVSTIRWMLRHGASIKMEGVVYEEQLKATHGLIKTFEEIQQMLRDKE